MPTLSEALRYFLLEERRPETTRVYTVFLSHFARAVGPDRDLRLVRYEDLADYFQRRQSDDHLKPATLLTYTAIVKALFTWTVAHGYLTESPARLIRRRPPSKDPTRDRAVPTDELRRMIDYAFVTSRRNHAIILFLADTACRAGGAASLVRAQLDLNDGYAILDEKGGKRFKARFGDETAAALRRWLAERPDAGHDFVWTGPAPTYRPLSAHGISQVIQTLAGQTGATRRWGAHSLRHAVGHAYAAAGIPPTVTQQKLGHTDVLTTLTHYYPDSEAYVDSISRANPLIALRPAPEPPTAAPTISLLPKSS